MDSYNFYIIYDYKSEEIFLIIPIQSNYMP